jgi:hypothetical protein
VWWARSTAVKENSYIWLTGRTEIAPRLVRVVGAALSAGAPEHRTEPESSTVPSFVTNRYAAPWKFNSRRSAPKLRRVAEGRRGHCDTALVG